MATKNEIGTSSIVNTSTFEAWKDLTNDIAELIGDHVVVTEAQNAVTPTPGMQNTGKLFLDGDFQLDPSRKIVAATIESTTGNLFTVDDNLAVKGTLSLNSDVGGVQNPNVIQFQTGTATSTWHIKTNANQSELVLGYQGSREIAFNTDGTVTTTTGSAFTFDNELLGPTIDGIAIGGTTPASGAFTSVTSTGDITGDLKGDVKSSGGQVVLDAGTNGNDAAFIGNVKADDGSTVLNSGTDGTDATFSGDVTGNLISGNNNSTVVVNTNAATAVFVGNLTGNADTSNTCTGNAATATKLVPGKTIGGEFFDGAQNVNLKGVNIEGDQDTTGNAATATRLQNNITIGGVSFTGESSISLDGVNQTGTQDVAGNILSGNDGVCLNRGATPSAALFSGTSERAKIVRIHSRPDGADDQGDEHPITFVDGGVDVEGTTQRSGGSTSFQNLEDHNMLTYNPAQQMLTVPKVKADILKTNGNVLVDISEGKFRGKADSASTASSANIAITANTCTGNAATASRAYVQDTEQDSETLGITFCQQDNRTSDYRLLYSDGGILFNPSGNILTTGNLHATHSTGLVKAKKLQILNGPSSIAGDLTVHNLNITGKVTGNLSGNATSATSSTKSDQLLCNNSERGHWLQILGNPGTNLAGTSAIAQTTRYDKVYSDYGVRFQPSTNTIKAFIFETTSGGRFKGNLTGNVTGNAETADKWKRQTRLSLKGHAAYTYVDFDGSDTSEQLTVTIKDNAGFKVRAQDITGLDAYVAANFVHIDSIHPVGSIYMTLNNNETTSTLELKFRGTTWKAIAAGRVLMGVGNSNHHHAVNGGSGMTHHKTSGTDTNNQHNGTVYTGAIGGAFKHKLSVSEMPSHGHAFKDYTYQENPSWSGHTDVAGTTGMGSRSTDYDNKASRPLNSTTSTSGNNSMHNNMQPYLGVKMFVRES
jgi:hypothetical protein